MRKQVLYDDGLVKLDPDGLTIRRYYFPLGTSKHIPYTRIKGVQERHMGALTGKGRLWGSGDLRHQQVLIITSILSGLGITESETEPLLANLSGRRDPAA